MLIEIRNLSKSFKYKRVINNLNLDVHKGDLILIQGMNGCGKSTLLKSIAGLLKPDMGEIKKGKDVKIGAFIENPNFIENETALFNMRFLIELTHKFDIEEIKKLFDMFKLDIYDKNAVKKYSIGMRQKLGIIQAIMENQNLLLFDEPTRGLDKDSMVVFNRLVAALHTRGKTCIICAHDGVSGIDFSKYYDMIEGNLIEKNHI